MCLDIDRESVIHKHLVKKIYDLFENTADDQGYNSVLKNLNGSSYEGYSKHHLTMLPSFHISLGEPPQTKNEHKIFKKCEANELRHIDIVPLIGDITLAPICISKKNGKKSAWIPIHPYWIQKIYTNQLISGNNWYDLNLDDFDSFDHRCDECPVQHLHVSVANLTGNPHDSIARPEDCIIDTITT